MSHSRVPFQSRPWCLAWGCSPGQALPVPFMMTGVSQERVAGPKVLLTGPPPPTAELPAKPPPALGLLIKRPRFVIRTRAQALRSGSSRGKDPRS